MESSFLQAVGIITIVLMVIVGFYLTFFEDSWLRGFFVLLSGWGLGSVTFLLKSLDANESIAWDIFMLVMAGIGFIIAFMALGARTSKYWQDKKAEKTAAS